MINILIPSLGNSLFFKDSYFPKPVIEILGKTMLEKVIENYKEIQEKHYIFIFDEKNCNEFHLDDSVKNLIQSEIDILILKNITKGALCSCLMAIEKINNETPLIIANCDQVIDVDYEEVVKKFKRENIEVGVITFDSIHPRWSYIKSEGNQVIEAAEKRPLSKQAVAGFYYYEKGRSFVETAKKSILKDEKYNENFYISSTINQAILLGKRVGYYSISREKYHSFYSPEKIKEYEKYIKTID